MSSLKKIIFILVVLVGLLLALLYLTQSHNKSVAVVVTIKPIHSLVCMVLQDVETPVLMEQTGSSPHTRHLRPSDINLLQKAGTVVWVGPVYETHMQVQIQKCVEPQNLVAISSAPNLKLLPIRSGPTWGLKSHDLGHHHTMDGHMWLDIHHAILILRYLGEVFTKKYPQRKEAIQQNVTKAMGKLKMLDVEIKKLTSSMGNKSYLIYHDALQYFDRQYKTKGMGALVREPGHPPSLKHIQNIQKLCTSSYKPLCVFSEPQYLDDAKRLIQEQKLITLDYLGTNIQKGCDAYHNIMMGIVQSFHQCYK